MHMESRAIDNFCLVLSVVVVRMSKTAKHVRSQLCIGVVNRCGEHKLDISSDPAACLPFEAK